jgi:hypothetical protein
MVTTSEFFQNFQKSAGAVQIISLINDSTLPIFFLSYFLLTVQDVSILT